MFHTARRPLGTFALLLLLAPSLAACTTTQRIPYGSTAKLDHLTGLTTRSGRDVQILRAWCHGHQRHAVCGRSWRAADLAHG